MQFTAHFSSPAFLIQKEEKIKTQAQSKMGKKRGRKQSCRAIMSRAAALMALYVPLQDTEMTPSVLIIPITANSLLTRASLAERQRQKCGHFAACANLGARTKASLV